VGKKRKSLSQKEERETEEGTQSVCAKGENRIALIISILFNPKEEIGENRSGILRLGRGGGRKISSGD